MSIKRKAVALISGGLDSMLAAKLILDQGIEVIGLNFYTGFCHSGHTSSIRNQKKDKVQRNDALWVAESLGIKLHIEDIVEPYKNIVINPKYGYGQHVNPCLDCKIFMVQMAHQWMKEHGYDFLITGEVAGQRPKSQKKHLMPVVEKQSGADDLLLRPLCAHILEPTKPEREGWVDRSKLHGFSGRSRKPQLALAKSFDIKEFAQPAGGCCVLTDGNYARRMEDMWEHRGHKEYDLDDIVLLKAGRHLRLSPTLKIILSRDQSENLFLQGYKKAFDHLYVCSHASPLVLIEGEATEDELQLIARICARFSKGREEDRVEVEITKKDGNSEKISVSPFKPEDIQQEWYL
jgi:tRNA U34 2-thiouridine synthase MnmA/TrmU